MRATIAVLVVALTAGTARADKRNGHAGGLFELQHTVEGGLFLGGLFPSKEHELYDNSQVDQVALSGGAFELGLRVAYLPIALAGVELEGMLAPAGTDADGGALLSSFRGHIVVQYPLFVTPFVVGGLGTLGISSDDNVQGSDQDFVSHIGLGAKYQLNDWLLVRLDARQIHGPRVRSRGYTTHYELLAGVSGTLSFAKKGPPKEKAEPAPDPDPDNDGVRGIDDQCPKLPGPRPTGCPVIDSDGDKISDHDDICPNQAEDMDGFEDEDGCPDTDNDKDGIPDLSDRCPDQAETVNEVEDEDGCPDSAEDRDGDGVLDTEDKCPQEPEDADGFEDKDGCPDPDNDGDGVVDGVDACPEKAGLAANSGCPGSDSDGDGVPDRADNCPNEAGKAEFYGCKKAQLVKLSTERIEILEKVYFTTAAATIRERSHDLLNNIAAVLKSHEEIGKLRIEGHTDNRGGDDFNMSLSQKRAEAVVEYLTTRGIASSRLEAVGRGLHKPIQSNETTEGRAANRRVEFNIVEANADTP